MQAQLAIVRTLETPRLPRPLREPGPESSPAILARLAAHAFPKPDPFCILSTSMPLRIVLDARRVSDFGIGTYIRNLVRALAGLDQENQYILITSAASVPEFEDLPKNFETCLHPRKSRSGLAQFGFSLFLRTLDADLFHIPLNAVP